MRRVLASLLLLFTAACGTLSDAADPASDAPEIQRRPIAVFKDAPSYQRALQVWRTPEDLNAWIGARFEYDKSRAMLLSETQRSKSGRLPIHQPRDFFTAPSGACVDLSRFAVETLRVIDPDTKPNYVMIEFFPITIGGNTLRLHWLTSFTRNGSYYFFADSKRPGHISGPYASTREFIGEYAKHRGRQIVAFRELDSYERKHRTLSAKQNREERP